MLTPVFHPNISPVRICIGDHWTASEKLVDLIIRIGQIIAYQSYNIRSPLDGEAARWVDEHESMLPIDNADLYPPE
jgi:ubiquitin-protein ligase